MRAFAACCFSLLTTTVVAHPVTYVFSGELTAIHMWTQSVPDTALTFDDPASPVVVNDTTFLDGRTLVLGRMTIDYDAVGQATEEDLSLGRYGGQILDWQMTFGGSTYYPQQIDDQSMMTRWFYYRDDTAGIFDELPGGDMVADTFFLNLLFADGAIPGTASMELPVDDFTGGNFRFIAVVGDVPGQGFLAGSMYGSITSLHRVTEVSEPDMLALLGAGLLGLGWARRHSGRHQSSRAPNEHSPSIA